MFRTLFKRILFLILLSSTYIFSQNTEPTPVSDNILWARYWLKLDVSKHIKIHEQLINQTFVNGGFRERQLLNHLFARYTGKKKEFYGLGLSYSNRWQDENIEERLVVPEYRTFEELGIGGEFGQDISSNASLKLEQRFYHNASKEALLPGYFYKGRITYSHILSKDLNLKNTASINGSVFYNIWDKEDHPTLNSLRTAVGLAHRFNKNVSLNLEYQLQMRKLKNHEKLTLDNVIRVSFMHTLHTRRDHG